MKKIILSLFVVGAAASALVAGTSAWFSSNKTISGNTMATGTLQVELKGDSTDQATFDLGSVVLEPGGETSEGYINIKNVGNLNLGWFGYFNFGGYDALLDVMYIKEAKMEFFKPTSGTWETTDTFIQDGRGAGGADAYYNTLADKSDYNVVTLANWNADNAMGAGNGVQMGALKPNYAYRMTFKLGLVGEADNTFQNKSLSMSYTVASTQVKAEALNALGIGDARIADNVGTLHTGWMDTQISHQTP